MKSRGNPLPPNCKLRQANPESDSISAQEGRKPFWGPVTEHENLHLVARGVDESESEIPKALSLEVTMAGGVSPPSLQQGHYESAQEKVPFAFNRERAKNPLSKKYSRTFCSSSKRASFRKNYFCKV